jgi:hypothetical protein
MLYIQYYIVLYKYTVYLGIFVRFFVFEFTYLSLSATPNLTTYVAKQLDSLLLLKTQATHF